jgi:hypothetical protein
MAGGIASGEAFGSPKVSQVVGLATVVNGYLSALERFRASDTFGSTADDTFIPLFEALNWAVSAADFIGRSKEPYLRALRFARNRVHHDWANALYFMPGAELGVMVIGVSRLGVASCWHWRGLGELPPAGRADAKGEKAYQELLGGQPAGVSLTWLESFLRGAAGPAS